MQATMLAKIILFCILVSKVVSQFNGEFWWLNDKLDKYRNSPPSPKYEVLTQFDTDESAKIVFRDNDLFNDDEKKFDLHDKGKTVDGSGKVNVAIQFQDKSEIVWPSEDKKAKNLLTSNKQTLQKDHNSDRKEDKVTQNEDVMEFKFPDTDNFIWHDTIQTTTKNKSTVNSKKNNNNSVRSSKDTSLYDKTSNKDNKGQFGDIENICTYIKKIQCNKNGGTVYVQNQENSRRRLFETNLICCILPLTKEEKSRIYFSDNFKTNRRYRRSNTEISQALQQRNALLLRRYSPQANKFKPTTATKAQNTQKIVTPGNEEYEDPYWNIKNSNFQNPNANKPQKQSNTKYEYDSVESVEDYIDELPTPGLTGLYSDHVVGPSPWPMGAGNVGSPYGGIMDDDDEGGTPFSYGATIDPRLENRVSTITFKPPIRGRPTKISTASNDQTFNTESQTIRYHAHPHFQVMQGFKLLNLMRNKSRIYNTKTTTESIYQDDDSEENVQLGSSFETAYGDRGANQDEVFQECGRASKDNYEQDRQIGDTEKGWHPWLALVILTKRRQSILCYATVVHPRAAVTAADCIHGRSSPGEISLVAGVWDLSDESHDGWQKRMVSALLHPQYRPGKLAYNLAILHWKRPLTLGINVQPACLSDHHAADDCKFYGWGGYDQAIRPRSKWQRASILAPRACTERLSRREPLPADTFCASVHSRGTVTGIGGPLMCVDGGRHTAVGVAVWRDHAVVLASAHEWTHRALASLRIRS